MSLLSFNDDIYHWLTVFRTKWLWLLQKVVFPEHIQSVHPSGLPVWRLNVPSLHVSQQSPSTFGLHLHSAVVWNCVKKVRWRYIFCCYNIIVNKNAWTCTLNKELQNCALDTISSECKSEWIPMIPGHKCPESFRFYRRGSSCSQDIDMLLGCSNHRSGPQHFLCSYVIINGGYYVHYLTIIFNAIL